MTNEEFLEFINKADRVDIDISPEGVWGNVSISTTALRELVDKHTNQKIIEELEDLKLCHGVCIDLEIEIALKRFGSVKKAAKVLKITEKTIYNYIKRKNG